LRAVRIGGPGITVTLGGDTTVEDHVKALGNEVASSKINEAIVDSKNRIITTPAYMAKNPAPHEIHAGIGEMVNEIVKLSRGAQQASQTQEVDWDFQDYFHLKIKKIEPKEWEFIKKEMKQKLEDEKKKGMCGFFVSRNYCCANNLFFCLQFIQFYSWPKGTCLNL